MTPVAEGVDAMKFHFMDRLVTPHATWDQTFQTFSAFISRYDDAAYENIMVQANQQGAEAKARYALREMNELDLRRVGVFWSPLYILLSVSRVYMTCLLVQRFLKNESADFKS